MSFVIFNLDVYDKGHRKSNPMGIYHSTVLNASGETVFSQLKLIKSDHRTFLKHKSILQYVL